MCSSINYSKTSPSGEFCSENTKGKRKWVTLRSSSILSKHLRRDGERAKEIREREEQKKEDHSLKCPKRKG